MVEKTQKDILIIGAAGLLGKALVAILSKSFRVYGTKKDELDITQPETICLICEKIKPKIIVLAAAFTDVDKSEEQPEQARLVNVQGFRNVAEVARTYQAKLIAFSSDYVFDGKKKTPYTENDSPNPLSVYAYSKWQGEKAIQKAYDQCVIIRTAWLFGEGTKGFVPYVIDSVKNKTKSYHLGCCFYGC